MENILYRHIKCINMIGSSSFYFKYNHFGYALFLHKFKKSNAKKWFNNFMILKEKVNN